MASFFSNNSKPEHPPPPPLDKKKYPWSETIQQMQEEQYQQEIVPPSSSSMPRYPPQYPNSQVNQQHQQHQQQQQQQYRQQYSQEKHLQYPQQPQQQAARGESVRVNYAVQSQQQRDQRKSSSSSQRRPRVGIFRSETPHSNTAESNLDSLELALQETSGTTSSTTSTYSYSPSSQKGTHSPGEGADSELAYILSHRDAPSNSHKRRGTTTGKPPTRVDSHLPPQSYQRHYRNLTPSSPNPTNLFASSSHNNNNNNSNTNSSYGRTPSPALNYEQVLPPRQYHQFGETPFEETYNGQSQSSSTSTSNANPFSDLTPPHHSVTLSEEHSTRQRIPPKSQETPSMDGSSATSNDPPQQVLEERLGLHILCAEATSPHDIAWRNALYLLGMQPTLAKELDMQGRTALHMACAGQVVPADEPTSHDEQPSQQQHPKAHHPTPPPCFIVRALLVANPEAVQHTDQDGRLPLHALAASSGDAEAMQLLVEAHPESIAMRDAMGWTPLHLFLLNPLVFVTVLQTQILLGLTLPLPPRQQQEQQERTRTAHANTTLRQRRGEHLQLRVEDLNRMRQEEPVFPRWEPIKRYNIPENILNSYPDDVRVCLRRLAQWERRQHREQQRQKSDDESTRDEKDKDKQQSPSNARKESPFACMGIDLSKEAECNPAAMTTLHDGRLPLHMIIHRGLLDSQFQQSRVDEPNGSVRRGHGRDNASPRNQNHGRGQHTLIVIVRLLISAYPEGLVAREINGLTPLLLAMVTASDVIPTQELLEILLGKRTAGYESLPSWAHDTPYPLQHMYTPKKRQSLAPSVERYSNPAMMSTLDTCQLPLHIAAEDWGDYPSLIVAVYESYPGAIHVQDARGRMPLHLLLENYRRITPHPQIMALLLSEHVAKTFTDDGHLPFDLLCRLAPYLPSNPASINDPISPNGAVVHPDSSKSFQKFFQASILASSAEARRGTIDNNILRRRAEARFFLVRLRVLPPWLRRQACSAPFVQKLLLEEMASPSKCAYVLMYGALLIALLVVLRRQMELFIDSVASNSYVSSGTDSNLAVPFFEGQEELMDAVLSEPSIRYDAWNTLAVYGLCAGSIGFQAIFWALSCSLGEFQHLCLSNIWRWIDFLAVLSSITTSILIHEAVSDDIVFFGGTAATGLLWCSLIGFLSNWWYEMAFFTGSLFKVARMIFWPLLVAGILCVGFAEMFYVLSQVDCDQFEQSAQVCSLRHAYRFVYYVFIGGPLVELNSLEKLSAGMVVLVAMFSLLVFLLFLCILVVVIVVASKCEVEHVALDAYWEPKLAFVLSSQDSRIAAARHKPGLSVPQPTRVDRLVATLAEMWEVQSGILFGNKHGRQWYARSSSAWHNCCLVALAALFIPLWLLVGLATLGFLWPPQVRQYLFQPRASIHGDMQPNEAREFFTSQVSRVKDEVLKIKDMSYEQSNEIHRDIQELRTLLVKSLKD